MTPSKANLSVVAHKPNNRGRFPLSHFLCAGIASLALLNTGTALALTYPYTPYNEGKLDPQLTGWPLTQAESTFLAIPGYQRRPGSESGRQQMNFLPTTPAADGSGPKNWYVEIQKTFVNVVDQYKRDHGTDIDILLVGDSITWQWTDFSAPYSQYPQQFNAAWKSRFGKYKAFNLGVAGDKTQGVLWRLDHGATQGSSEPALKPKVVILAIGHNNMYFSPETGIKNAASGILWCVKNLRERFPDAQIIVSKILPNNNPQAAFYKDAQAINAELDPMLAAENDPKLHVLPDMWKDMTNPDGTLIEKYFRAQEPTGGKVHLSAKDGYQLWADKLQPLVTRLLEAPAVSVLKYPYAPYNEGKMDPQLTGWPLTPAEIDYLKTATYKRRPGSEAGRQRMDLLPVTPAADGSGTPNWYVLLQEKLVKVVDQFKKDHGNKLDILLVGDSITWQWTDIRAPYSQYPQKFNNAWKESFGQYKALNLGVGGDKTQGVLWRLDHGATQGSSGAALKPRVVILAIGHNNMYFTPETGIQSAANGIVWCVKNLRAKFPDADIIVSKILPNTRPETQFYKDAKAINAALDPLLAANNDSKVHVLPDMWNDMTNPDGTLIESLYRSEEPAGKKIHLHPVTGYQLWASRLKPLVDTLLHNNNAQ